MDENLQTFYYLASQEITGQPMTQEEIHYVEQQLENNPAARQLYDQLLHELTPQTTNTDTAYHYEQLLQRHATYRQRRKRIIGLVAAGITILILWLGYLQFMPWGRSLNQVSSKDLYLASGNRAYVLAGEKKSTSLPSWLTIQRKGEIYYLQLSSNQLHALYNPLLRLHVPAGKTCQVQLADGSNITVYPGSELQFQKKLKQNRQLLLTGEAYFQIQADAHHPMRIRTPQGEVSVLGTAFVVRDFGSSRMEVRMESGKVQLQADSQHVQLRARQIATYASGQKIRVDTLRQDPNSWSQGKRYYEETSLQEIFTNMERYYATTIISDTALQSMRVSYLLRLNMSIRENLAYLQKIMPLTFHQSHDSIYLQYSTE